MWERIEGDLPAAPRARRPTALLAIAAVFAAFGGGVLVGKIAFQSPLDSEVMVVASSDTNADEEVAQGGAGSAVTLSGRGARQRAPSARGTRKAQPRAPRDKPHEEPRASAAPSAAAEPAWIARVKADDYGGALDLLRRQPGGLDGAIASARSAQELMDIATSAQIGRDNAAAQSAFRRVIERFPDDQQAHVGAYQLGAMYERMGQVDQAKRAFEECRRLAPKGALAGSALCELARIEKAQGHKDEAHRMAQEYEAKYPGGHCEAEMESILQGDDGAPAGDAAR